MYYFPSFYSISNYITGKWKILLPKKTIIMGESFMIHDAKNHILDMAMRVWLNEM